MFENVFPKGSRNLRMIKSQNRAERECENPFQSQWYFFVWLGRKLTSRGPMEHEDNHKYQISVIWLTCGKCKQTEIVCE